MTLLAEAPFPIEKSLLRKDAWQRVKFGDMAECITDRVDNPAEAGVDRYVGLDHLDPDTLSIRRWGLPTEVESTKLRFQPGDIIFGKRRAYQRKLAVADFEGICSAHAMVLRAREETVIKDFLPVFMQSNVFFERALAISVGSLSPTINWKTLAVQEFDLPPLDEQRRIAEVLRAADNDLTCREETVHRTNALISSTLQDFLDVCDRNVQDRHPGYERLRAESIFDEQPRNGLSPSTAADAVERYSLSIGCVQNGRVIVEGHKKVAKVDPAQASRFPVRTDDILIVRGNGNKNLVGLAGRVPHDLTNFVYPDLLIRVTFDRSIIRVPFAVLQWNHRRAHDRLLMRAKSSNGIWKVNGQDIRALEMLVPPIQEQDQFLDRVSQLDRGREAAVAACHQSLALRQKLTGHLL